MSVDTWTDSGCKDDLLRAQTSVINTIQLFQNNHTFVFGDVKANLTVATFTGYAGVSPSYASNPTITSPGATMVTNPAVFTVSGTAVSNTIYGWYALSNQTGTECSMGGTFAGGPFTMNVIGQTITVTLTVTAAEV